MRTIIIVEFMKLSRIYGASIYGLIPVYGVLSTGSEISILQLLLLFLIGILYYAGAVALNDYAGAKEEDRFSKENKPLVTGAISKKKAMFFYVICTVISFSLLVTFFRHALPLVLFLATIFLWWGYCFLNKKAPGMEILGSLVVSLFILLGASAIVHQIPPIYSMTIALLIFVFTAQLFEFGIIGGLKDCGHDYLTGTTTVLYMGATQVDDKIIIPKKLKVWIGFLESLYIIAISMWFIYLHLFYSYFNIFLIALTIALIIALIQTTRKFIGEPAVTSLRRFMLNRIVLTYCGVVPIMLYPFVGVWAILLAVIPPIWHASVSLLMRSMYKSAVLPPCSPQKSKAFQETLVRDRY